MQENPPKYAAILGQLLKGKTADETYRIEYGDRKIGFVFTAEAVGQLVHIQKELETGEPSPTPTPSPPSEPGPENQITITESLKRIGWLGLLELTVLSIMAIYSSAIIFERFLTYHAAKQQSRAFAPRVAQALKNDRIEEAIKISDNHRRSHLAMVVNSGLQEVRAHEQTSDISDEEIEASKRAMRRSIDIKTAEFKRGLSGLATIGWAAPLVGLLGLVSGLIYVLQSAIAAKSFYNLDVATNILNGLFMLAVGLAIGIPARLLFSYFTSKVDGFIIEMNNSASELLDYFLKEVESSRHKYKTM